MDQENKSEDVTRGVAEDVDNIAEFEATTAKDPLTGRDIRPARPETVEAVFGVGALDTSEASQQGLAMDEKFEELGSVRRGLDRATERLNACIEDFEQQLRERNPGVSGWVDLKVIHESGQVEECMLGFHKIKDDGAQGWHLVIAQGKSGQVVRLIRASRLVRVAATRRFQKLLSQIVKRSEDILRDVEAATEHLQKTL